MQNKENELKNDDVNHIFGEKMSNKQAIAEDKKRRLGNLEKNKGNDCMRAGVNTYYKLGGSLT